MTNELKVFAAGSTTGFYEAAMSYFCDKKQTVENKNLMQDAFLAEVERKSNVAREGVEMSAWMSHPNTGWVK